MTEIFKTRDFLDLAIDRLGRSEIDFCERLDIINAQDAEHRTWGVAGVLLPLIFRNGEFAFKLIKRSTSVVQGGDISCPGGMLHPFVDSLMRPLLAMGFPPVLMGKPKSYALQRGSETYRTISLFLTTAVRESWEEMRLNPFNVKFLGPLACSPLIAFTRVIFPLCGFIKSEWNARPSWEVEKVVEIPLRAFFDMENYAVSVIETDYKLPGNLPPRREFMCFILNDNGQEEVLWGATFFIIANFFKTVLDLNIPPSRPGRSFERVLQREYLMGRGIKKE